MYRSLSLFLFLFSGLVVLAQTDTIVTYTKKIPCRILEIHAGSLKYKLLDNTSPVFVISTENVFRYQLMDSAPVYIRKAEQNSEKEELMISSLDAALKTSPISFLNNHFSLSYEKLVKPKLNFEIEIAYINNHIFMNPIIPNEQVRRENGRLAFYSGYYLKTGLKFY